MTYSLQHLHIADFPCTQLNAIIVLIMIVAVVRLYFEARTVYTFSKVLFSFALDIILARGVMMFDETKFC